MWTCDYKVMPASGGQSMKCHGCSDTLRARASVNRQVCFPSGDKKYSPIQPSGLSPLIRSSSVCRRFRSPLRDRKGLESRIF